MSSISYFIIGTLKATRNSNHTKLTAHPFQTLYTYVLILKYTPNPFKPLYNDFHNVLLLYFIFPSAYYFYTCLYMRITTIKTKCLLLDWTPLRRLFYFLYIGPKILYYIEQCACNVETMDSFISFLLIPHFTRYLLEIMRCDANLSLQSQNCWKWGATSSNFLDFTNYCKTKMPSWVNNVYWVNWVILLIVFHNAITASQLILSTFIIYFPINRYFLAWVAVLHSLYHKMKFLGLCMCKICTMLIIVMLAVWGCFRI